MKTSLLLRGLTGLLLLTTGAFLVRHNAPSNREEVFRSPGCVLSVRTFEPAAQPVRGSVFLLHGLAANSYLMDYYTRAFLSLGLRVIVPDLPGHGRSAGPFSPSRAEACAESLFQEKIRSAAIDPPRAILAGHSLGGALALRIASRNPVAGVLAISPAPLLEAPGVEQEILLFPPLPRLPPHSLLLSAALEPAALRNSAAALAAERPGPATDLQIIPAATHTSLLVDAHAMRISLDWAARLLALPLQPVLPARNAFLGSLLGLLGLCLLAGIFLKLALRAFAGSPPNAPLPSLSFSRYYLAVAMVSVLAVILLIFSVPLRFLRIFTADYLASFFLLAGVAFFAAHAAAARALLRALAPMESGPARPLVLASALGLATALLFFLWFRFSLTSTWLDLPRLWRFPSLAIAMFPFFALEEALPDGSRRVSYSRRLAEALAVRIIAWLAMTAAVYHLHSAQALLVLLIPFFALFTLFHRLAMDLFRRETRSPSAAALFGAILAAGFLVLVFPLT